MAQPTFRDARVGPSSVNFGTRAAVQVDFGTSAAAGVIAQACGEGGANATGISSFSIGGTMSGGTTTGTVGVAGTTNLDGTISGGTALTLEAQDGNPTLMGAGAVRAARAAGVSLTGVQWVQVVFSDGNGKPSLMAATYDNVSAIAAGTAVSVFSATISQSVTTTTNDVVLLALYSDAGDGATLTPTGPAVSRVRGSSAQTQGRQSFAWDSAGLASSTTIAGTSSVSISQVGTKWAITGTASTPALTAPTGAATGPTQATIGVTSDTTGSISSLILPAATAAPADAATLIANGAAVVRTIGTAGVAQTFPITGLTTNTAVKVHWAMAGSNVRSSAAFTPNTLAISGTALSAQTGTAGAAFAWTGATPESLITNTGNGSGSWSATAGVGASGVTVNSATGILVAGSLGAAGSYTITLQRSDGSTVPGAQTVTKTVGLTISGGGGGGDTTLPTLSAASVTGGTLSATGSVTSNEAGTLFWKMDGTATATDPGAGSETGAGWSSQSLLAAANAVSFGVQPAGLRYGHYLGVDAAGNRSPVANASGTVSGSGATTYTAQTDIIAVSGVALASTLVYWTWSPAGRPGAFTSPVNGSSTTDSTGRATISHTVAGDGMVLVGTRPGPVVSNDRVFAQFLTLA